MKKIFNIFCVVAAIVALASCAKENLSKIKTGSEKVFEAGFNTTRTAVDSEYKTTWVAGDKLVILNSNGESDTADIPAEAAGTASATISTTIAEANDYYAVYGDINASLEGTAVYACIPETQTGAWGEAQIATAIAVDKAFSLKNISSIIEFEVSDQVSSVEFYAEGKFNLEAYVTFTDATPTIGQGETSDQITVNTNKTAGKFYASTFPSELEKLTITLNYDGTSKVTVIDAPVSLTAGKVLKLGNLETRADKTYKVASKKGFTAISGDLDDDITFTGEQGTGTNPTIIKNGNIRIYKPSSGNKIGGLIKIVSKSSNPIKAVKLSSANTSQFVGVSEGTVCNLNDTVFFAKNSTKIYSNLNASTVVIFNAGSDGFDISSISVTYALDSRLPQTLSFPEASYIAELGKSFSAPAVSGANTPVTYSTSNPEVATVNASTGAVTLVAAGECIISAKAAESDTYKEGNASYSLTVASFLNGIAGIKEFIRDGQTGTFVASVEDMLITYAKLDAFPYIAYAEDKNGDAVYFYSTSANAFDFKAGDKFTGIISGAGLNTYGYPQIGTIDLSAATKTSDNPVTPHTVTIADLNANFADYEFQMIKIEDATVNDVFSASATGAISQESSTISVRGGSKSTISVTAGSIIDLICFPTYFKSQEQVTPQVMVWNQDQITVKSEANVITMDSKKTVAIGEEWTIGATCKSGDVSYTITEGSDKISLTDGKVTGVAAGTAVVKATSTTSGGYSATEAYCTITVTATKQTVETLVVGTYAVENSWESSKAYTIAATKTVTFTASGTGNNCKYYSTDSSWRFYNSGNGTIKIDVPSTKKITKVVFTASAFFFATPENWTESGKTFTPNQGISVNTITFSNGSGTSKVQQIEVSYE